MRDKDLILGGVVLGVLALARRGPTVTAIHDEFMELRRDGYYYYAGTNRRVPEHLRPDGKRDPQKKGPPAPMGPPRPPSSSSTSTPAKPSGPPPLPDVEQEATNPSYQRVSVATAEQVLLKLGAEIRPTGVFAFETAEAWHQACYALRTPGDYAFERASNSKAWVDPKSANALAKAATAGRKVLPLADDESSEDADESAVLQSDPSRKSADELARDALEAARRAAQAAAQGRGEDGGTVQPEDLGTQTPVPEIPHLPNPPPTPINLPRARQSAPKVDKEIKTKRDKYSRAMVKQFQEDAGLVGDGLYGPVTQSALRWFGVRDPAKPVFKNKNYTAYEPPAGAT